MNRTDPTAKKINGIDPQHLIDKTLRDKIYQSIYWQRDLSMVTPLTILTRLDKILYIGTVTSGTSLPVAFISFVLKLLQLGPSEGIILSYLRQEDNKYLRCLAAVYLRLITPAPQIYLYLEPLLCDFRKIRIMSQDGKIELSHIDEVIAKLLTNDSFYSLTLPHIQERHIFEQENILQPRQSMLMLNGYFMTADLLQHIDTRDELNVINPFVIEEEIIRNKNIFGFDDDDSDESDAM